MADFNDSAAPNLGAMMLDICRPDGPTARLGTLLGSIENMRLRLGRASRLKGDDAAIRCGVIAMEECAKILGCADLYRKAAGLPEPIERGVR